MSTAASAAEWLRAVGIGTGAMTVAGALMKLALDGTPPPARRARPVHPAGPASRARHAGPAAEDETQPLLRVQPHRGRHSKGPAWN
ncbi:hypothetical protein OG481_09645 [Streptomyces longwoodensis]|uniref:hypothetical protein n=1 Tax=Streptomyces longwoodensis TaxID=68231 RepID=UPI002DDA7837|nr:hypothetical protein [Streptomyces longwoodensis]WRY88779.1 hypothetical protein OG481_09645 [Streptomyces longwoodensis]